MGRERKKMYCFVFGFGFLGGFLLTCTLCKVELSCTDCKM